MQNLDSESVQTDPNYRYEFLCDFIGFGKEDIALIQASAPFVGPQVPSMVEQTYAKLLSFDATAIQFVPRQHGFEGTCPVSLNELSSEHPQIQFRKDHLNRYFVALFTRSFDKKMVMYLDMVGKIHTTKAGNKDINVPLYQMNALMGLISDILSETIANSNLAENKKVPTIRSYQKLLWIQNDFISRHYA